MLDNYVHQTADSQERETLLRLYKHCKDFQCTIAGCITDTNDDEFLSKILIAANASSNSI